MPPFPCDSLVTFLMQPNDIRNAAPIDPEQDGKVTIVRNLKDPTEVTPIAFT
jgi:hypothetical protein